MAGAARRRDPACRLRSRPWRHSRAAGVCRLADPLAADLPVRPASPGFGPDLRKRGVRSGTPRTGDRHVAQRASRRLGHLGPKIAGTWLLGLGSVRITTRRVGGPAHLMKPSREYGPHRQSVRNAAPCARPPRQRSPQRHRLASRGWCQRGRRCCGAASDQIRPAPRCRGSARRDEPGFVRAADHRGSRAAGSGFLPPSSRRGRPSRCCGMSGPSSTVGIPDWATPWATASQASRKAGHRIG